MYQTRIVTLYIIVMLHSRKAIIVMPVWADGEDNARRLTDRGAAVRVHKGDDGDTLYNAIVEARYWIKTQGHV